MQDYAPCSGGFNWGKPVRLMAAFLVALLGLAATAAWAQPANDNFTNATSITGNVGAITGTNTGATSEPGEPVDGGTGGGKTIWYAWTASFTGSVAFSTEGSSFDTVLSAYSGSSLNALTLLAANDDVNFPLDQSSRVVFPVTFGNTYYLQVDGFLGAVGSVNLTWQPTGSLAAGNFWLAVPTVPAAPTAAGTIPVATTQPVEMISELDIAGTAAAQMRVVRTAGTSGRVQVGYVVTNTTYIDIFQTNIYGTNIFTTNFNSNMTSVLSFTNVFITNFYTHNQIQNYTTNNSVGFFYCEQDSGTQLPPGLSVGVTNGVVGSTNIVVSAPNPCANLKGTNITTNSDGTLTLVATNIFCTNVVVIVTNPSAVAGVDYLPTSGTVLFNDYQMGQYLPMEILGNEGTRNRLLLVQLTNAALDPLESTSLGPPTVDPVGGSALVCLAALSNQGGNPATSRGWTGPCYNTNSVVNFEQSLFQISDSNAVWIIGDIIRIGTNTTVGCSVNWTVGGDPTKPNQTGNGYPLQPGSDYANPFQTNVNAPSSQPPNYTLTNGTVTWGANDTQIKSFTFRILKSDLVRFNEDFQVTLSAPQSCVLGQIATMTVTILFDTQPAGAVDRDHNANNVANTLPPFNNAPGANNLVYAAVVQPDNKTVFAGDFTAYDTTPRNSIARMNTNGLLDTTFMAAPNSGSDGVITCLAFQPTNNSIYIGGQFTSFNGTNRNSVARLTSNGSLDPTFNPGLGVNGTVWSMQLQTDGKLLIAGDFTTVNGTNRNNIARLNADGSLDTTFDPGIGPNDIINAIALQSDGRIVLGGNFSQIDNTNYNFLARLNSNGSLDTSFNIGAGPDNSVYALAIQTDGKILAGGGFATYNLISSHSIARVNSNGSLDSSFFPGSGADDTVFAVALQPDGGIFIGGQFMSYNSTRRVGLARLYANGVLDTTFMDTAYNQFAGITRDYFNEAVDPGNFLLTIAPQADGNVIIGGSFNQLGGGVDLTQGFWTRDAVSPRMNIARLIGGSTPGPGNIGLAYPSYSADKFGGASYITLVRTNGALGPAAVSFTPIAETAGPGAAISGVDFTQTTYNPFWTTTWPGGFGSPSWDFADCYIGPNVASTDDLNPPVIVPRDVGTSDVFVNVINNPGSSGNLALDVGVFQPQSSDIFFLGGENIPIGVALTQNTTAPMTIVDNTIKNGVIGFTSATFSVIESGTNALITITRTNGSLGLVTITASTTTGGTAVAGTDYVAVSTNITFNSGVTSKTFVVGLRDNHVYAPDKTLNLLLSNPTGGATLGQSTAVLTIINDNFAPGHVNFIATNFSAHETSGAATVSVSRTGGSQGTLSVTAISSDGTGTNGLNYGAATNTLSWNANDVAIKTFSVPLIHDGLVTSNLTVKLRLTNTVVAGTNNNSALGLTTNATVTIINDDFFGSPTFSTPTYSVNNNGGFVTVTVNRLGGSAQTINVNFTTADGTGVGAAFAGIDYTTTSGTLTFAPGVFSQSFNVPITPKTAPVGNLTFSVVLSGPTPASGPGGGVKLGNPSTATVTVIDALTLNEPPGGVDSLFSGASFNDTVYALGLQPNGQVVAVGDFTFCDGTPRNRLARLNSDGSIDPKFSSSIDGADASIRALDIQTDGQILVGGLFTQINGVNSLHIGRLTYNGAVDTTFTPGSGADNPVYAIAETFAGPPVNSINRRILIGGSFVSYNGVSINNIAQLNNNGTLDTNFSAVGANGTVYAVAVYSTNDTVNGGRILIGGDFTQVGGIPRNHIARLNADGTLDSTFNPGVGPSDSVRAIAIQVDGKVVIGGLFTTVNGVGLSHIARLNPNGQVDGLFNVGSGLNDTVTCIILQEDHRIVVGGDFTQNNGVTRNRLTRLNSDGSIDPGINFGTGADNFVSSVVIQPDDEMIVGGAFTHFNGVSTPYITRIFGRNNAGAGSIQFTAPTYSVVENITNIVIGVQRLGGTAGTASVVFSTSNGSATNGVNYIGTTNTLVFPTGETLENVTIPIISNNIVDINRTVNLALSNPTVAVLGGQPTALLTIINDNSGVNFSSPNFSVIKNAGNGAGIITVLRGGSSIGPASVDFTTTTNGTATNGLDYTAVSNTVFFADGQTSQTVAVPVINNGLVEGNRTVSLSLGNPTNTVLLSPATATLTIVDNNQPAGSFTFQTPTFTASETGGSALITVVRTNGSTGQVSVHFATSNGTGIAGVNYVATNGNLTYQDGVTSQTFSVPLIHDPQVTGNVSVNLTLSNPSTGTQIVGANPATLSIADADIGVGIAQQAYFVNDTNGIFAVGVQRLGNTNGSFSVNFSTADGTATNGVDYAGTNGTLSFANGETFKSFNVSILRNATITGNRIFLINLSNPSNGAQLGTNSSSSVTILDTDVGLFFASATNGVNKSGTNVLVNVLRAGSPSGIVSVSFRTADGTATANTNYTPTNGVLTFADGQTTNSFTVSIINDQRVDPDLVFTNLLFNPVGAQLLTPSSQTVTITNDVAGFSFSSAAYSIGENGVSAAITVVRTGTTNGTNSVSFATTDGSAQAGNQYFATNGTLIFTNGQVSQTFNVRVVDKNITGGTETVLLSLSNPSSGAVLANPNAATLTILNNDGSLIVPAGAALTSESGPVNGAIDPGETVTMLLALRNVAGTNTGNLTARLLATNGVTSPSPATPVSYGVLITNGLSVSQPFTFTASGSNGSQISLNLQLQDGPTNLGTATYTFTLGTATNSFTNSSLIVINDNAPATPYPAALNVSGIVGTVGKVTVTLSNVNHGSISDVNVLLVGPTGANTLLMANTGGGNDVNNLNLTFDDSGAALTGSIPVSGTYRPTQFTTNVPFPISTNNPGLLPKPFGTTLSVFTNTNPNGTWQLYVLDDVPVDSGTINNGWSLHFTTLGVVPPTVDLVAGLSAPVSVVVSSNLTYNIAVTNAGPSSATGVQVTDVLPPGAVLVSSQGAWTNNSGTMVCSIGSLARNGTATASLTVSFPAVSQITNTITVTANETDANPADNTASAVTAVVLPSADLAVGVSGAPDPVLAGGSLTYTIIVTNLGPATATNVMVTNTLPPGANFVSVSPAGIATNFSGTVIGSLGTIGNGGVSSFSILVTPTVGGTNTDTVTVGSPVPDPLKGNNKATVKTVVQAVQLNVLVTGSSLTFTWPTIGSNYTLQTATSLAPPVTWSPVGSPTPQLIGGSYSVTLTNAGGTRYFRLTAPGP